MKPTGNFTDPTWEPTEAEEESVREGFRRTVLFREAMAARGIKILAMNLTPNQEHAAVETWWREEGAERDRRHTALAKLAQIDADLGLDS